MLQLIHAALNSMLWQLSDGQHAAWLQVATYLLLLGGQSLVHRSA